MSRDVVTSGDDGDTPEPGVTGRWDDQGHLRDLVDSVLDPLAEVEPVLDRAGRLVDVRVVAVNRALREAGGAEEGARLLLGERSPAMLEVFRDVHLSGEPREVARVRIGPHPQGLSSVAGYVTLRVTRIGDRMYAAWRDVTAHVRQERSLRRLAVYDALTGLPNRTHVLERLQHELARLPADGSVTLGVLFLDLDRFKAVNDVHGHVAGDHLLMRTAERLRHALGPTDVAARLAGDEFLVLCPGINGPDGLHEIAERALQAITRPLALPGGAEIVPTASIGCAVASSPGVGVDTVVRQADEAMYHAKHSGGQRVGVYEDDLGRRAGRRLRTETDLHQALTHGWFALRYQPIVDLRTGAMVAAEALLRMAHPSRGLVSAGDFIDVAEQSHLMVGLGEWVLHRACQDMASWNRLRPLRIAVNVAARHAMSGLLGEHCRAAAAQNGIPLTQLKIELTERVLMHAGDRLPADLVQLTQEGVQIALDDFGTGYSSLTYVQRLPVSTLKIDQSFVAGLGRSHRDDVIVEVVVALGSALGVPVVAEGVETPEQRARLLDIGCSHAQGHLFHPALEADGIAELLAST